MNEISDENINNYKEISFNNFIKILRNYKFFIFFITALISIFSVYYSLSIPNKYVSKTVVYVEDPSGNSSASIPSGYSNLASLAGINIQKGSVDMTSVVIERIRSKSFLKSLLDFEMVLPNLMAVNEYDQINQKLTYIENDYDSITNTWIRETPHGRSKVPSHIEAHEYYIRMLDIKLNKVNNFITLSVTHKSPVFSHYFLDLIVRQINQISRDVDIKEAESAMVFLNNYLKSATTNDLKELTNALISSKLKSIMVANIDKEYLVKTIDAPYLPEKKSSPNRSIICILGFILGLFLSVFLSLVHNYLKSTK